MKDTRIEQLAQNLLEYSVSIQPGENLLLDILGEDGMELGKELARQARKKKVNVHVSITNYEMLRILLQDLDEEQIKQYAKYDLLRMKDMDAYIGIRANSNSAEFSGIGADKMELYNQYYTLPVHFEERVNHTKWCILRYPNASMAQMSKKSTEEMEDFYFQVCNLDYAKMKQAMEPLVKLLNQT